MKWTSFCFLWWTVFLRLPPVHCRWQSTPCRQAVEPVLKSEVSTNFFCIQTTILRRKYIFKKWFSKSDYVPLQSSPYYYNSNTTLPWWLWVRPLQQWHQFSCHISLILVILSKASWLPSLDGGQHLLVNIFNIFYNFRANIYLTKFLRGKRLQ